MSNIVERVAKALAKSTDQSEYWTNYVVQARAAIAAMREPTDAMKDAATDLEDFLDKSQADNGALWPFIWQAMIDACLQEANDTKR
jgi:hypothetical protein